MFGRKNRLAEPAKPTEIISHWPKLIENLQFSSQEFYERVEKALHDRQVPDIEVQRVDWKEGGLLSPRREYLRVTRERLVFDICGAPFGTGFFVSLWCGIKPLRLGMLFLCVIILAVVWYLNPSATPQNGVYGFMSRHGVTPRNTTALLIGGAVVLVLATIVVFGRRLDNVLIGVPVVGFFYERFFRSITYYRIDRMCMYEQAVRAAVMQVIDEITSPRGITPLSELDRRPILNQLFVAQRANGRK